MSLAADIAEAMRDLIADAGGPALYTPAGGGTPVATVAALEQNMADMPMSGFESVVGEHELRLRLPKTEVGNPLRGATVLLEGVTYTVQRKAADNGAFVVVVVR